MMCAMLLRVAPVLLFTLLFVACGDDGEDGPIAGTPGAGQPDGPSVTLVATALATAGITPQAQATSVPDETLPAVVAAREDVATRFERAPEEIEVVSVTPREWPDSCLGVTYVGQQDEVCAQVITPGYEVVLRLGDSIFTYHTDEDGTNVRLAGVDIGGD